MSSITLLKRRFRLRKPGLPGWLSSLRGNFTLFVILFCLLQALGVTLLTAQVNHTQSALVETASLRERLALLDKARIELLTASDDSHRAGIYLMQDQQSGSVDSWKSLADSASASLQQAKTLFAGYHAADNSPLAQGFTLLAQGLEEQLKGLKDNQIDAFFMVPMQAYQQQFNDAWFAEIDAANKELGAVNHSTLESMTHSRNLSLIVSALLFSLLITGGVLLARGVITPLRHASHQLQQIATGDLLSPPAAGRLQARETQQLFSAMAEMRQGLRHIVHEINTIAASVAAGAGEMQQHNARVSEQHQAQNASFTHLSQRLRRVAEEVETSAQVSQQATQQAYDADTLMQQCVSRVDEMETQMRQIVDASGDIAGIVEMLESLSLQTRLLALNAAIESAHAGVYGRSFSVVAKEIGMLSSQSSGSTQRIDGLNQHTQQNVTKGFNKVKVLEKLFQTISGAVAAIAGQLQALQQNATAQSKRVSHIAAEIHKLDETLQASAGLSTQQQRAADTLQQQAARLAQSVQQFRI